MIANRLSGDSLKYPSRRQPFVDLVKPIITEADECPVVLVEKQMRDHFEQQRERLFGGKRRALHVTEPLHIGKHRPNLVELVIEEVVEHGEVELDVALKLAPPSKANVITEKIREVSAIEQEIDIVDAID